jgi:hypothetical protein
MREGVTVALQSAGLFLLWIIQASATQPPSPLVADFPEDEPITGNDVTPQV